MGLFDFVREAGKRLGFGGGDEKAAAPKDDVEARKAMASALIREVQSHHLSIKDLEIGFKDGVATVSGTTETQAEKEKVVLAVGNVNGVAQVDDRIQVVTPQPEAKFHTVVRGDTLSKIAKTYYGNAMKYPVIFEANKPMLTDPDKIYPGQVLRIPPVE